MPKTSEARLRANIKYKVAHTERMSLELHKTKDAEIIAKLASVPSKQAYVKALIRADIAKQQQT